MAKKGDDAIIIESAGARLVEAYARLHHLMTPEEKERFGGVLAKYDDNLVTEPEPQGQPQLLGQ